MTKELQGLAKKWEQLQAHVGTLPGQVRYFEPDATNRVMQSAFSVGDETMPFFVVLNDTVYTMLNVYLRQGLSKAQTAGILPLLNGLNERLAMLKFWVNENGQLILGCSVPAFDDDFNSELITALLGQMHQVILREYPLLAKTLAEAAE